MPLVEPAVANAQVAIDILSTSTPQQVAAAVATAVAAAHGAGLWSTASYGPICETTCLVDGVIPTTAATTGSASTRVIDVGGQIGAGTRQYWATYESIDAAGQFHTSAPSNAFTVLTGAKDISGAPGSNNTGAGNNQATLNSAFITIPTLRVTARGPNVQIGLFRSIADESGGAVGYRIATIPNNTAVDSVTYLDTVSDANITSADPLYTSSGEIENIGPPSAQIVVRHGGRVWLGDLDDQDLVWFSKPYVPGYAPAWSDLFTQRIDRTGGPVRAMASMDSYLVIFKEDRTYALTGPGPDATGQNGSFDVELVTADVGCLDAAVGGAHRCRARCSSPPRASA